MKTINYKILLIILLIFASCKTEDSSSDAGIDSQDTADVSNQEDTVEDINLSDNIINCIDNDGDQYGQGDDCIGLDCNDDDPDNWISCSTCIDSDLDGWYIGCDSYETLIGPDCDDNVKECTYMCNDYNHNNKRDCDEDCIDNDKDGYGIGSDCLGPDCDDNTGTCTTDCSDNDGDGIEDCNFCIDNPHEITTYLYSNFYAISFKDDYGFVCNSAGFDIVDLSNPELIQIISNYSNADCSDVYVDDNYAYLASRVSRNEQSGGIMIIDVSDVNMPYEVAFYNTNIEGIPDIHIQSNYVYSTSNNDDTGEYGMKIIDVSNPANPQEINFYKTSNTANAIYVRDNYVFLGDNTTFYIIDVTDPNIPVKISSLPLPTGDIIINGNYAYINNGITIVDISDTANPIVIDIHLQDIIGSDFDEFEKLYAFDNYVLVSVCNILSIDPEEHDYSLHLFDISDINSPQVIADFGISNHADVSSSCCCANIAYRNNGYFYFSSCGIFLYSLLCEP